VTSMPSPRSRRTSLNAFEILFRLPGGRPGPGLILFAKRPFASRFSSPRSVSFLAADGVWSALVRILSKEVLPRLSRVAVLRNPNNQASAMQLADTEAGARALRLQIQLLEVKGPDGFERAFEAATRQRADAVFGLPDTMLTVGRKRLAELAVKHRLPTMYQTREHPESGSLMSYGPNIPDLFRRAASYVDKILQGAKPGDLQIEQPTKFEMVINLKTAKTLGLTIPPSVLQRADEVIE